MANARRRIADAFRRALAPPPKQTVSAWADAERMLSAEASSKPGRWRTEQVAPAKGVMDAFSDPQVERVTVMVCAQLLKTEVLNNVVGFHIHRAPAPMLVLQPTLSMGEAWSKDRLAPMIRDTPALAGRFEGEASDTGGRKRKGKAKDSNDTILHKKFAGGHVTVAGANSPASLASRPIQVVLCDEVDRYPASAGSEGDPVNLAAERTNTFWNRKIGLFSTPTVKGYSRIEASYETSDMRRLFVACPHCGQRQTLRWTQVRWDDPATAAYRCERCDRPWSEGDRIRAVRAVLALPDAGWRQTAPFVCGEAGCEARGHRQEAEAWTADGRAACSCCGTLAPFKGHAGFHCNALASPWTTVPKLVAQFLEAKRGGAETLKVFVNTKLAETWEEDAAGLESSGLFKRRTAYEASPVPAGVALVTVGGDMQDDRGEFEFVGWGKGDESWSLDYVRVTGDPSSPAFWEEVDDVLKRTFLHPSGQTLRVEAACLDSGGHHTAAVYDFVRPRFDRRVYAIKGVGGEGRKIWPDRATKNAAKAVNVFLIGVDTIKERVYSRLQVPDAGPGYCHFPTRYDEAYFEQLTAEKVVTKYRKGFPHRVWEKAKGARNEALDCRVYATAARVSLNIDIDRRVEALGRAVDGDRRALDAVRARPRGVRSRGIAA